MPKAAKRIQEKPRQSHSGDRHGGKTSPIGAEDVARVVAAVLVNPQPHIGKIYDLTGPLSEKMHFYAQVFHIGRQEKREEH